MQKRTKKEMDLEIGQTLVEYFIKNTQADKSAKKMAQLLAYINSFVFNQAELKRKEIEEFGDYFFSNGYGEITRDERTHFFGENDAYVLNIYYEICEEEERKRIQEEIEDISPEQRCEAMALTDEIFRIKENKVVTLSTLDGPITFTYNQDSNKHTEILKQEFFNYVAYAIKLGMGGVVVRIKKKPKDWLLGIRISNGKWEPLRAYEFMEKYVNELDLSVQYTELPMRN
jgi:hypothetical protein